MRKLSRKTQTSEMDVDLNSYQLENKPISASLKENIAIVQNIFNPCDDLHLREFVIGQEHPVSAAIFFIDPATNYDILQRDVMEPLLSIMDFPPEGITINWLMKEKLPMGKVLAGQQWSDVIKNISSGLAGLFIDGLNTMVLISVFENNSRSIPEPSSETVTRGPQDGFTEDIRRNTALLRKRLHTPRLAIKQLEVGEITRTRVNLVYLKGIINENLVTEIEERINRIKIDGIVSDGQLEEFLRDSPWSLISTVNSTERPDVLAAALLEGRAGLIFDNTPFCLIIPVTMVNLLQSPEDYYDNYWFSSFIRLLRWSAFFTSLLAPALYIAVTTFHQELLPTQLLLSIIISREKVPFPGLVEALVMEMSFEILREAGVRLPRAFGQTISIVGAIVIGQAAVSAGLVSPAMVVVVSLTAISSFSTPSLSLANSVRILRFIFMLLAASLGLFGIMVLLSVLVFYLCSVRSFGIPYLSPLAPVSFSDLKDVFIRVPVWMMDKRPRLMGRNDLLRQASGQKPGPPPPEERGEEK